MSSGLYGNTRDAVLPSSAWWWKGRMVARYYTVRRTDRRTVQSQSGGPRSPADQTNSPADRVVRSPADSGHLGRVREAASVSRGHLGRVRGRQCLPRSPRDRVVRSPADSGHLGRVREAASVSRGHLGRVRGRQCLPRSPRDERYHIVYVCTKARDV